MGCSGKLLPHHGCKAISPSLSLAASRRASEEWGLRHRHAARPLPRHSASATHRARGSLLPPPDASGTTQTPWAFELGRSRSPGLWAIQTLRRLLSRVLGSLSKAPAMIACLAAVKWCCCRWSMRWACARYCRRQRQHARMLTTTTKEERFPLSLVAHACTGSGKAQSSSEVAPAALILLCVLLAGPLWSTIKYNNQKRIY